MGRAVSGAQYADGIEGLRAFSVRVQQWWSDGWDILVTPTIPEPPLTLGQFAAAADNPLQGVFRSAAVVPYCAPFNVTGQPAVSLPLGSTADGALPIGVQFVAAYGREDVLVRLASQLEQAQPWADRHPPV
jgi:amidase